MSNTENNIVPTIYQSVECKEKRKDIYKLVSEACIGDGISEKSIYPIMYDRNKATSPKRLKFLYISLKEIFKELEIDFKYNLSDFHPIFEESKNKEPEKC